MKRLHANGKGAPVGRIVRKAFRVLYCGGTIRYMGAKNFLSVHGTENFQGPSEAGRGRLATLSVPQKI